MCTKAPETKASVAGGAVAGGGGGGGMAAVTTGCVRIRRVFCLIEFVALSEFTEVEVCGCGSSCVKSMTSTVCVRFGGGEAGYGANGGDEYAVCPACPVSYTGVTEPSALLAVVCVAFVLGLLSRLARLSLPCRVNDARRCLVMLFRVIVMTWFCCCTFCTRV